MPSGLPWAQLPACLAHVGLRTRPQDRQSDRGRVTQRCARPALFPGRAGILPTPAPTSLHTFFALNKQMKDENKLGVAGPASGKISEQEVAVELTALWSCGLPRLLRSRGVRTRE